MIHNTKDMLLHMLAKKMDPSGGVTSWDMMINIYGQGRIHLKEIVYAELRKTEPSTPI